MENLQKTIDGLVSDYNANHRISTLNNERVINSLFQIINQQQREIEELKQSKLEENKNE